MMYVVEFYDGSNTTHGIDVEADDELAAVLVGLDRFKAGEIAIGTLAEIYVSPKTDEED